MAREQRQRTAFPKTPTTLSDLRTWTEGFTSWFNDRYAFRQNLISAYASMQYAVFGQSGFPDRVLVGSGDFLFLGDTYGKVFSTYAGLPTWSEADAAAAFRNVENIRRWFAEHNIPFLCSIVPDKHTVYQEYLPTWVRSPNRNLPAARLRDLARDSGVRELHYAPEVLQHGKGKYGTNLYWATDTHWSQLGAFLYYQDIMRQLNATGAGPFKVLPETTHTVGEQSFYGDLSTFLGYVNPSYNPALDDSAWPPLLVNHIASGLPICPDSPEGILKLVKETPHALNAQKILIIGDSFTDNHLLPLFLRSFQSVLVFHHDSAKANLLQAIEAYQPDVVLLETVERDCLAVLQNVLKDLSVAESGGQHEKRP